MKSVRNIIQMIIFFLMFFPMLGQEVESLEQFETGKFLDKENKLLVDVVQSNLLKESSAPSNRSVNSNQVFINQIGFGNKINSNISSSDAVLNLEQKGNDNSINIDLTASSVRYNFSQRGNNNIYEHIVNNPLEEVSIDHVQEGNNNLLQNYGTNSIGQSLQVKMTGNSETVIIRNFN